MTRRFFAWLFHRHEYHWVHLPQVFNGSKKSKRLCHRCSCGKVSNVIAFPDYNPVVQALNDHTEGKR